MPPATKSSKLTDNLNMTFLLAVAFRYLQVLEDTNMGFADVLPAAILNHL
jgi:hypothetical protein